MSRLEKINSGQEYTNSPKELEALSNEQHESLREKIEKAAEQSSQEKVADIKNEALEKARSVQEKQGTPHTKAERERRKNAPLSKQELNQSFKKVMTQVQSQLPAPSRTFSRVIHNKTVEKVSDVMGSTVARPNAILAGSFFAFISTLGLFLIARNNGYPLSGTETMASFAVGWAVGLLFDYLRLMITGRSS